jgi:hypothetical protein
MLGAFATIPKGWFQMTGSPSQIKWLKAWPCDGMRRPLSRTAPETMLFLFMIVFLSKN